MSPLTSGRLSHSSEPLNGGASLTGTDSPPISPSDEFDDVVKVFLCSFHPLFWTEEVGEMTLLLLHSTVLSHKYNKYFCKVTNVLLFFSFLFSIYLFFIISSFFFFFLKKA